MMMSKGDEKKLKCNVQYKQRYHKTGIFMYALPMVLDIDNSF